MLKRTFDIALSLAALVPACPLFMTVALWIKLDARGPVFYRGVRVGRFGKPFQIYKFRTMVANADQIGGPSTADYDPRITEVGRFLRRYKVDELPQLFNVLKVDMSLVGPRPEVQAYVDMFSDEERDILSVRPGITDWASLWNPDEGAVLKGSPDPEKTYLEKIRPKKIRLQLQYVHNRSFWVDIRILTATALTLLGRRSKESVGSETVQNETAR